MSQREQDDASSLYRTPGITLTRREPVSNDEQDFSTLKLVQGLLHEKLKELYGDFNAFDILKTETPAIAAVNLLRQVEAKQTVFDILVPLVEAVDSAVQKLDAKYKER